MKTSLFIIGAGSVGMHIAANFDDYNRGKYKLEGFLDDDNDKQGSEYFSFPVLGEVTKALDLQNAAIIIGIAFPGIKRHIVEVIKKNSDLFFPSLIHPKSWISADVSIGAGAIIYPGTTVNYGADVGDYVVLNMNCAIGHHTEIGAFSSFAPGVNTGGHTKIGNSVEMGIGASTLQNVWIGEDAIVGGQSMITKNVHSGKKVAGVPVREL